MLKVSFKHNSTAGPLRPVKSNPAITDGELTDSTFYLQTTTSHPLTHNMEMSQTECNTNTYQTSDSPQILCSLSTPEAEEALQAPPIHQNSSTASDPPMQLASSSSFLGNTAEGSKITLVNLHTKDGQNSHFWTSNTYIKYNNQND